MFTHYMSIAIAVCCSLKVVKFLQRNQASIACVKMYQIACKVFSFLFSNVVEHHDHFIGIGIDGCFFYFSAQPIRVKVEYCIRDKKLSLLKITVLL